MTRLILILTLASLACIVQAVPVATNQPTLSPTATHALIDKKRAVLAISMATATILPPPLVTVLYTAYTRDNHNIVRGAVYAGQQVAAVCDGLYCVMDDGLRIWRGCTDNNPDKLGCEAK